MSCEAFSGSEYGCLQGNYTGCDLLGYFVRNNEKSRYKSSSSEVEQFITNKHNK